MGSRGQEFDGTIVRLPLRSESSDISTNVVAATDLRTLLEVFIEEELSICLMFLRNLTSVEMLEIDDRGMRIQLAKSHIQRSQRVTQVVGGHPTISFTCNTRMSVLGSKENLERWVVQELAISLDVARSFLSKRRIKGNPTAILQKHKLDPSVAVAYPIAVAKQKKSNLGRLFTYLPLPIYTGFPVHIHALFALTQSRQNLFNVEEVGVVHGTDHRLVLCTIYS